MNKYWFRKRRGLLSKDLGYGWIPISWEGWLWVILMIGAIIAAAIVFVITAEAAQAAGILVMNLIVYLLLIVAVIGLSALVSHRKTRP